MDIPNDINHSTFILSLFKGPTLYGAKLKKSRIFDFGENDCQQTNWPSYRDARTLENLALYIYDHKLITYFTWIALL